MTMGMYCFQFTMRVNLEFNILLLNHMNVYTVLENSIFENSMVVC